MFEAALRSVNLEFGHELTKQKFLSSSSTPLVLLRFLTFMAVIKPFNFCGIADGLPRNTG